MQAILRIEKLCHSFPPPEVRQSCNPHQKRRREGLLFKNKFKFCVYAQLLKDPGEREEGKMQEEICNTVLPHLEMAVFPLIKA